MTTKQQKALQKEIATFLLESLDLRYTLEMSDYATSREHEKQIEKAGKAQVQRVAKRIVEKLEPLL